MHIRRPFHRPRIQVWCHLRVIDLGHGRDLLHLPNATGPAQRRLQNRRRTCAQHRRKFCLGRQSLAGCNRNAHRPCNLGHLGHIVRWNRLLIPKWRIRLQRLPQPDRACRGKLPMGAEQQIRLIPHSLPNGLTKCDRLRNIRHRRHMPPAQRIWPGRIKLYGGKAARDTICRRFCRHFRRGPECRDIMMRQWIEIGIGPHARVHLAPEQRINRSVPIFAQYIPAGNLKPRKRAHHGQIWPLREPG